MSDLTQPNPDREERLRRTRERMRKRQEREQGKEHGGESPRRVVSRQLIPEGAKTLPTIDARYLRIIGAVGAAGLFMGLIVLGIGMFKNDPVVADPNALWAGTDWTYDAHDDDTIIEFVDLLRENRIGTVYAQVSELNLDNTWTGDLDGSNQFAEVEDTVSAFAAQMRRFYPEVELYGVLSIRTNIDEDGYRLDEEALRDAVGAFSTRVVNRYNFDGVLIDAQPVWDDDDNYLELMRTVRDAIGDEALLAVAVPPDWTPDTDDIPMPSTIAPGTVWSEPYKQRIALLLVDQIVLRGYNSYMTQATDFTAADYSAWLAYQVEAYADAITPLDTGAELMVLISTQGSEGIARDAQVETVSAALTGVWRGFTQIDNDDNETVLAGVALMTAEETDSREWQQYREGWLRR